MFQLFHYSVITEDGVVLLAYAPWEDVQELLDFGDLEPIDIFCDHDEPDESLVTVNATLETINLIQFREKVRQILRENPPTATLFTANGEGVTMQFPEYV